MNIIKWIRNKTGNGVRLIGDGRLLHGTRSSVASIKQKDEKEKKTRQKSKRKEPNQSLPNVDGGGRAYKGLASL